MLSEKALNSKLAAVHRVLTRARTQAYRGTSGKEMGRILDDAEYLVGLLLNGDPEGQFRAYLQHIEENYAGFEGLTAAFDAAGTGEVATARLPVPSPVG